MKSFALSLVLSFASLWLPGSGAHAQIGYYSTDSTVVPVQDETLRLLGRGYVDKRNPDAMFALACIQLREDQQCGQARFVVWKNKDEAFYVHQGFHLHYTTNAQGKQVLDLKKLKEVIEFTLVYTTMKAERTKYDRLLIKVVAPLAVTMGIVAGMPWFGALYVPLLLSSEHGVNAYGKGSFAVSFDQMMTVVRDQNGWNWSSRPKRMKHKGFQTVIKDLTENQKRYIWDEQAPAN